MIDKLYLLNLFLQEKNNQSKCENIIEIYFNKYDAINRGVEFFKNNSICCFNGIDMSTDAFREYFIKNFYYKFNIEVYSKDVDNEFNFQYYNKRISDIINILMKIYTGNNLYDEVLKQVKYDCWECDYLGNIRGSYLESWVDWVYYISEEDFNINKKYKFKIGDKVTNIYHNEPNEYTVLWAPTNIYSDNTDLDDWGNEYILEGVCGGKYSYVDIPSMSNDNTLRSIDK